MTLFEKVEEYDVYTPYGSPSDKITVGLKVKSCFMPSMEKTIAYRHTGLIIVQIFCNEDAG